MRIVELKSISGPNVYAHQPVIKLTLDLEEYCEVESNQLSNFNKRLEKLLPGLQEHHCSLQQPGGFIRRLEEGTYLGHIIEHIAIELLVIAGQDVYYGKTIHNESTGVYEIIFEYKTKATALLVAKEAITLVEKLIAGEEIDKGKLISRLKEQERISALGPSTAAIVKEAKRKEIPVTRLGVDNSLIQLGYGRYSKLVEATIGETTSCVGVDISCDKAQTRKLLNDMGVLTPRGIVVTKLDEAVKFQAQLNRPVITKPVNGNQGTGVTLNLENSAAIKKGFKRAKKYSSKVLVEEYINGSDYRLLVVDNKVVAGAKRVPAYVVGDGEKTIKELIIKLNQDPDRGIDHEKPLTKVRINDRLKEVLSKAGYSLEAIPSQGETVYLQQTANLSTGGIAVDCTDQLHPDIKRSAIRAAKTIGLDIAGVDLVTSDITKPLSDQGAIIEVNSAPGIRMHHYPSQGKSRNVAKKIVNLLDPARIPIVSITGTNGKTTTARMIRNILSEAGIKVGMAATGGIKIGDEVVLKGDTTGPLSAQTVLRDKDVEAAVLETARGGILRDGLGYDWSDIGIITNITADHLGQDGIETVEEIANIKSLVIERVRKNGYAILNANDPQVVAIAKRSNAEIIYCSLEENNLVIERHLAESKPAVYLKEGNLTLFDGEDELPIMAIDRLPAAQEGLAKHILENALFAIAAGFAYGIPTFIIRTALCKFGAELTDNPGRLNVLTNSKFTTVIDYGHNPAGYRATLNFAKQLVDNKLIGVIGVPGDRGDDLIEQAGQEAGSHLDRAIIKEDIDLRGRDKGEVAKLLKAGASKAGLEDIEVELKELEAIKKGLSEAEVGDVVVIFYEQGLEQIIELVEDSKFINHQQQDDEQKIS
ncbi:cyanophycin synthetase [Halobacteroides halobius DSM 5150]|uniref:Cyanophycin synthetase n=1 Tax=Halobacteroides halobius (strain ATCC 35273 / DSM 5150 / MD-1) TaxID=748449 RepID=L0K518_HALHC|nr:cyanophycin synthetase [Halobacteroides halobius]AGB40111.1 cyanophycin synthetase [Halobacteroides halobius DSM 5150]